MVSMMVSMMASHDYEVAHHGPGSGALPMDPCMGVPR